MDRHRRLSFLSAHAALFVLVILAAACSPPSVDSLGAERGAGASEGDDASDDEGAGAVLQRLADARTARVEHTLSIEIPDSAGASTYFALTAQLDRSQDRAEGVLDSWTDEGEHGSMTTWPDGTSTVSTARIIGDTVHMRFGDPDAPATDAVPWRDVTSLGDTPPVVAHLESVDVLVGLLLDAVDERSPEGKGGDTWRGTVPAALLGELWQSAGPIGSVVRLSNGMPSELVDDVHAYEIADRGDGTVALALWLDVERLADNVGEELPPGALESVAMRLDVVWEGLDEPVDIPDPESVADRNRP